MGKVVIMLALASASGCGGLGIADAPARTELAAAMAETPEAILQMRRGRCASDNCPVYGVSIFMDGTVTYEGYANVATVGRKSARISSDDLSQLIISLDEMRFLDSAERCCVCSIETVSRPVVLDYRPGSVQKTVFHDEGCRSAPPEMAALEHAIDRLTGVAQWTGPVVIGGKTLAAH